MTAFTTPVPAQVVARLNVRAQPTTRAARVNRLLPSSAIVVDRWLVGEEVLGNGRWYGLHGLEQYVWSGGVKLVDEPATGAGAGAAPPAGLAARLHRRANGTVLPLKEADLIRHFGDPGRQPSPRQRGRIDPTPAWKANLASFQHPALDMVGALQVHRLALPFFQDAFDEIVRQKLDGLILTCAGTWLPRHIDWNPNKALSSHAFGVAIDLNDRWNPLGREPALPGDTGSLRELVPILNAHGFAWGGHFTRPDGMHFELALDPP